MIYDLSNEFQVVAIRHRLESMIKRKDRVELTEKRARTLRQNSYLHLCLAYFASQTGNTLEFVKERYYKLHVNKDLFVKEKNDKILGHINYVRSSSELSKEEMTLSIDRFRNWASEEAGIYLPEAENAIQIAEAQLEVERFKQYI